MKKNEQKKYQCINTIKDNFDISKFNVLTEKLHSIKSVVCCKKLKITQNYRTIEYKANDFFLRNIILQSITTANKSRGQIQQQIKDKMVTIAENVLKIQHVITITWNNGKKEIGVIATYPSRFQIHQTFKLLVIKMHETGQEKYCFITASKLLYCLRAVHCCKFSEMFYHSLFGISKKYDDACVADLANDDIKHNSKNPYWWISPYVNSHVPLLYHSLPLHFIDCIKK